MHGTAEFDVSAGFRGFVESDHQVEHMCSHLAASAVRTACRDGGGHFRHADAADVFRVRELQRLLGELFFAITTELYRTTEGCSGRER